MVNSAVLAPIDAMASISLAEMENVELMNRVDAKYVGRQSLLNCLLESAAPHYRVLKVNDFRASPYKTLYFDGPDFQSYLQHHNGKLNRYKVRMREYGSSGAAFLEVKIKNSRGRTVKTRRRIDAISESFSENATAFLQSKIGCPAHLRPQLWTEFTRVTLGHKSCPERITIDCDLQFRSGDDATTLPDLSIIEVKQERDDRQTAIRRQLREQHVRPLSVSKYCLGTVLLNKDLKCNRFKSVLRALAKVA